MMFSLVYRFFLAAWGEACMFAEQFLFSWRAEFSASVFIKRLCAGAENSTSLFIPCVLSKAFQCRWRLFWMLKALDPVSIWARMVHSVPPLLVSSCQLHSNWGRSLSVNLYLRTFSSNSTSRRWMKSTQAVSWDRFASAGPMILMLSGRLGWVWFLECTNVSFWEFFCLTNTGHTLVPKSSQFGGIEMPREEKNDGCTSEWSCPLFPPSIVSC